MDELMQEGLDGNTYSSQEIANATTTMNSDNHSYSSSVPFCPDSDTMLDELLKSLSPPNYNNTNIIQTPSSSLGQGRFTTNFLDSPTSMNLFQAEHPSISEDTVTPKKRRGRPPFLVKKPRKKRTRSTKPKKHQSTNISDPKVRNARNAKKNRERKKLEEQQNKKRIEEQDKQLEEKDQLIVQQQHQLLQKDQAIQGQKLQLQESNVLIQNLQVQLRQKDDVILQWNTFYQTKYN